MRTTNYKPSKSDKHVYAAFRTPRWFQNGIGLYKNAKTARLMKRRNLYG